MRCRAGRDGTGFRSELRRYSPLLGDLIWRITLATFLKEVDIRQGLKLDLLILRDFAELLKRSGTAYIVCLWDVELYGLTSRFREGLRSLNGQRTLYLTELNEYLALFHRSHTKCQTTDTPTGSAIVSWRATSSKKLHGLTCCDGVEHYHLERHHQGLGNTLIAGAPARTTGSIRRRPRLVGSLNDYERAA